MVGGPIGKPTVGSSHREIALLAPIFQAQVGNFRAFCPLSVLAQCLSLGSFGSLKISPRGEQQMGRERPEWATQQLYRSGLFHNGLFGVLVHADLASTMASRFQPLAEAGRSLENDHCDQSEEARDGSNGKGQLCRPRGRHHEASHQRRGDRA